MRSFLALIGCVLALGVVGCGPSAQHVGGVLLKTPVKSIVSLSPGATEMCFQLGLQVLGRTESCNYPPTVTAQPVVMKGVKPNIEAVIRMKPKGVVYDSDIIGEADIAKLKELGIQTFDLGGDSLAQLSENLQTFASATGSETNASSYVDRIRKTWQDKKAHAPTPPTRMAIVMPGNGAEAMLSGTESYLADVVEHVGGELVGPKGKLFQPMNVEQFRQLNPDVVVVAGSADSIRKDPRFTGLKAWASGRVFSFKNTDILLRKGSRTHMLIDALFAMMLQKGTKE